MGEQEESKNSGLANSVPDRRVVGGDSSVSPAPALVRYEVNTDSALSLNIILPSQLFTEPAGHGVSTTKHITRGLDAIQSGGRLLLYDTILLGGEYVQVLLTLKNAQTPEQYIVDGQIEGKLPSSVTARLSVGNVIYRSEVQGGKLQFRNVTLDGNIEHIILTLEKSDQLA